MQGPQQVLGRSPCGGTCPWSWAEPQLRMADGIGLAAPAWVPAPLSHRSYGRPWPSLSLGAESQGCSWGEAPERPRWCQGLGVARQVVPCSWRDGGRVRCLQGPRDPGALRETGTVTFVRGCVCDVDRALWPWVPRSGP